MAGVRRGSGAALWIATAPGKEGYERYPYLLQALSDLGAKPPFRSQRLWAFFDSAYRSRVDLDYFAARWRAAGIGALHVAGWHYWESNPENDAYLRRLIEACHRQAILVYVWLELPHVSEKFWADHPEWREKTALLQDAQLDWRKLMNLTNRDCFAAVAKGVKDLIQRFDWDGVNLAELYFESLEGAANPARFTPMNSDVREEFRRAQGFDPIELFQSGKPDAARLSAFLDFRAGPRAPPAGGMDRPDRIHPSFQARSGFCADARGRSLRPAHARADRRRRRARSAAARPARLHFSDRRSGHHLEPRTAALSEDRASNTRRSPSTPASWPSTSTSSSATRTSIPPSSRPARNCSSSCTWRPSRFRVWRCISRTRFSRRIFRCLPRLRPASTGSSRTARD